MIRPILAEEGVTNQALGWGRGLHFHALIKLIVELKDVWT